MEDMSILTEREREVVERKLKHKRLTHQDSNYLSRFVRPKLRKIAKIDAVSLLERINYNPASLGIERKIKKLILGNVNDVDAIMVFGSAIQTGYRSYNDIDVIIIVKNALWNKQLEKARLIAELEEKAERDGLVLDVQILTKKGFYGACKSNLGLIYQLADHRVIYGKVELPREISFSKMELRMKLDWSDMDSEAEGKDIYLAIRNTILVRLLMNGVVDNSRLNRELKDNLGEPLLMNLKNNKVSKIEKMYALKYLNELTQRTREEIINAKWERIKLQNR